MMMTSTSGAAPQQPAEVLSSSVLASPQVRRAFFVAFGVLAALGPGLEVAFGLPSALKWIDELLLGVLVLLVAADAVRRRRTPRGTVAASVTLVAYTAVVVVSAILNRTSVVEAILGWRSLAQFFVFYVALVAVRFGYGDLKHFFAGFLATALVHVPFAIDQLIAANTERGMVGTDDITGVFGAGTANLLGYFCALILVISFCLTLAGGRRRYWLVAFPLGFVWPLTSANGSYLVFALLTIAAIVMSPYWRRWQSLVQIAVFVVLEVVCIGYLANTQYHVSLGDQLFSPVKGLVRYRVDHAGNPGRLVLTRDTVRMLTEHPRTFAVGLGPGTVGTVPGRMLSNFPAFKKRTGANFVSSSAIAYLAELGASGVAVVMLGWAYILSTAWRARRLGRDREEAAWLLAVVLLVPFIVLAGGGDMSWTFQPLMYPIGALTAYAAVLSAAARRETPTVS